VQQDVAIYVENDAPVAVEKCSILKNTSLNVFYVTGVSKELYSGIPNVNVWRVLRKLLHLKAYRLSIVQGAERWIVCKPLSVNVFVSLVTL
jgi:hypothetical protein